MERQSFRKEAITKLRKPASIIAWIAIIGFTVNMLLVFLVAVPDWNAKETLRMEAEQKRKLAQDWLKRPLPDQITPDDYQKLYAQVPSHSESAGFLLQLKELEQATGVALTTVSFSGGEGQSVIGSESAASKGQTGIQPSPTPATQQTDGNGGASGDKSASQIQEEAVSLSIEGTYGQAIDFLDRLRLIDRIVSVREWRLQGGAVSSALELSGQMQENMGVAQTVSMSIKLVIYYSKLTEQWKLPPAAGQP